LLIRTRWFYLLDVASRNSWPKGLRIVFWVSILGFIITTSQLIYYFLISPNPELFSGIQGVANFVDYGFLVASIIAGLAGQRRLFTILLLIEASLEVGLIAVSGLALLRFELPAILTGRFDPRVYFNDIGWYLLWCTVAFGINSLVIFYLCYYELRRADWAEKNRGGAQSL
jgi:hypothetical protein